MPRFLARTRAVLLGPALVACFFGVLAALSLGFSREAPLPRESATVLLVVSPCGAVVSAVLLWGLNRRLNEAARVEGRTSGRR